tara:strand:- start:659 stop:853 length:195 start_codon:yes stop_codon:yes gene_type:complete
VLIIAMIAVAMIKIIVPSFADHPEVVIISIYQLEFSQSCIDSDYYTPSVTTVEVGDVAWYLNLV